MSFGLTNEDDDDFGSLSNNSSLASLFYDSGMQQQSTSKSLVYTAPKQPLSQKVIPTTKVSQVVIAAAAVTCYKLQNEKYEALAGKIGLALLGESDTNTYQIILYQNKQKPLTNIKIACDFVITSQPDNFCTFYDNLKQNWAVLFDSKEVAQKFCDEVENVKSVLKGKNKVVDSKQLPPGDKMDGPPALPTEPLSTSEEANSKSKLISRIAKLGQPILPVSGTAVTEESDSDQTRTAQSSPEVEQHYERTKPKKSARPIPTAAKPIIHQPTTDYSPAFNSMMVPSHQYQMAVGAQQSFPMMQFIPPLPSSVANNNTHHIDTLMSENRIQNSEVRMHLCRLTDKIDLLLQKCGGVESHPKVNSNSTGEAQLEALATDLKRLQGQSTEHSNKLDIIIKDISNVCQQQTKDSSSITNEEIRLLDTERNAWILKEKELEAVIQKLSQQNERLSHQYQENLAREKDADVRIKQLEEEINQLKTDSDLAISSIPDENAIHLQEENLRLTTLLNESTLKVKEISDQHSKTAEKLLLYETKCGETESRLEQFQKLVEEKDSKLSEFQEKVAKLERELTHSKSLAESYQTLLKKTQEETKMRSSDSVQDSVEEQVKTIMNKSYKEIMKQFSPDEHYSYKAIKSTVSVVIRDVTLAALNGELTANTTTIPVETIGTHTNEVISSQNEKGDIGATDNVAISDKDRGSTWEEENKEITSKPTEMDNLTQSESEPKERSISFLETLHSSMAAASLQNEQTWKPDPPPPPLFDDFDNEDDWLV